MVSPGISLRRVHRISLVDVEEMRPPSTTTDVWLCTFCHVAENRDLQTLVLMCGCALSVMLMTLAVVLPTPHDYCGTVQGGFEQNKKGSVPF